MSSEISTKARGKPDTAAEGSVQVPTDPGLQPWQFFVLAALGCATAVTFMARGRGVTAIILLSVLMASAALVGMAALRALRPLVGADEDRTPVIGRRTRVALEREKMLALRSIKELEFDRAMGKLSEDDWKEMSTRLRARAARLMRQLDAGEGYRAQIARELERRMGASSAPLTSHGENTDARGETASAEREPTLEREASAERVCTQCETKNDADARFCKGCGAKL